MSDEKSALGEEKISRRQFIAEQAQADLVRRQGAVSMFDVFMVRQGISDIAIDHPEWDMDNDLRTRAVWLKSEDVI